MLENKWQFSSTMCHWSLLITRRPFQRYNLWKLDHSAVVSKAIRCLIWGRHAKIAISGGIRSGKGKNRAHSYFFCNDIILLIAFEKKTRAHCFLIGPANFTSRPRLESAERLIWKNSVSFTNAEDVAVAPLNISRQKNNTWVPSANFWHLWDT